MVGVLNELIALLQFIYNYLLNFDNCDEMMTPPNEGDLRGHVATTKESMETGIFEVRPSQSARGK